MLGPMEAMMWLMRDEIAEGSMALVVRDSRIVRSEGERREVSIEEGWA